MTSPDLWPIFAPIAVLAIVGVWKLLVSFVRWISQEVATNVVQAIGDSLSTRWRADMDKALQPVYAELQVNGGNSLKDKVIYIDQRLTDIEHQLEAELLRDRFNGKFNPDDVGGSPI